MPTPPAIDDLHALVMDRRPGAVLKVEGPFGEHGRWWLEVDGMPAVYDPALGFGLFRGGDEEPRRWTGSVGEAAAAIAA